MAEGDGQARSAPGGNQHSHGVGSVVRQIDPAVRIHGDGGARRHGTHAAVSGDGGDDSARSDEANPIVAIVGDIEVARGIQADPSWHGQPGSGSGGSIAGESAGAAARDGSDDAVLVHLADSAIPAIRYEQIAGRIHRHVLRGGQMGGGGRSVVTGESRNAVAARIGADGSVGRDLSDAVDDRFGDIDVAGRIHRQAGGIGYLGAGGEAAVAARAVDAGPRDSGYGTAGGGHLADAHPLHFRNVEVAGGVHSDGLRLEQTRAVRLHPIARIARGTHAGDGGDDSVGVDPANPVIEHVGDEEIARAVARDSARTAQIEVSQRRGTGIADVAAGHGRDRAARPSMDSTVTNAAGIFS